MTAGALTAVADTKPYPWIFNPFVDLFFCCGGLFWVLVGLHLFICGQMHHPINQMLPAEGILLLVGSVLFANPHVAATHLRLYGNAKTRNRLWFHSYASLILFIPLIAACVANPVVLAVLIRVYASLTFDHTLSQNYGITLMYCYKAKYMFENWERIAIKVMFHALTWYSVLRQFTYIEFCPKQHLGFRIPMLGPIPEWILQTALAVLVVSTLTSLYIFGKKAWVSKQVIPLPAFFLIFTSLFMFTAGLEMSGAFFLFTPSFFHAAQYLVVSSYYNLRESGAGKDLSPGEFGSMVFSRANLKYYGKLMLVGSAVFALAPFVITSSGVSFTTAWAAVFICGGFHHFLADSAIWKLKDPAVRDKLVTA